MNNERYDEISELVSKNPTALESIPETEQEEFLKERYRRGIKKLANVHNT